MKSRKLAGFGAAPPPWYLQPEFSFVELPDPVEPPPRRSRPDREFVRVTVRGTELDRIADQLFPDGIERYGR